MPGRKLALTGARAVRAIELYKDGLSRRQVAAVLKVSDMAVRTLFERVGYQMRPRALACAESCRKQRFAARRITSVFDLAA